MWSFLFNLSICLFALSACSADQDEVSETNTGSDGDTDSNSDGDADADADTETDAHSDADTDTDTTPREPQYAELWYSSGETLVYIDLNEADGTVDNLNASEISGLDIGQNALTMLPDGSLLGSRITDEDPGHKTQFFHIPDPPRDGSPVTPVQLGYMPDNIGLEALYTDCDGRLYGMDTGADNTSSAGNRLIRFTGSYLSGDFSFVVVSDLSVADVADIDDMSPAVTGGAIVDNPGLAIDSGNIYEFNFEYGNGTQVATGGDWGIHALGGELFDDGVSRIYILSAEAELFELTPDTWEVSAPLVVGPDTTGNRPGHSSLAGPLTNCETGFVIVI